MNSGSGSGGYEADDFLASVVALAGTERSKAILHR